jgi:hypothetical protein
MQQILERVAALWARMFTPPWRALREVTLRRSRPHRFGRPALWTLGWGWSLVGLTLGAFLAPALLNSWGLAPNSLAHALAGAGVAALMGYVVQVCSFGVLLLFLQIRGLRADPDPALEDVVGFFAFADILENLYSDTPQVVASAVLLVGEGGALWWYLTTQGTHQGVVATYVLGGFLIKGVILGVFVNRGVRWLRGERARPRGIGRLNPPTS